MKLLIDLVKGEEPKRSTKSPLERLQRAKEGYEHPDASSLAEHYAKWCEANNLSNEEFESRQTPMSTLYDLYKLDDGERYNLKGTGLEGVVSRGQAFILTGLPDFEIPDDSLGKSLVTLSKSINRSKLVQKMVMVHRADGSIVRRMQWVDPTDKHSPHNAPHVAIVTPSVAKMHINRYEAGEPDQGFERYLEHNNISVDNLDHVSKDNPVVLPMTNEFSQNFMEQMSMVHPNWKQLGKDEPRITEEELDNVMRRHETDDYSDEPRAKYPGDEGWQEAFDSNHSSTAVKDDFDDLDEGLDDEDFEDDFDDDWEDKESYKSSEADKQSYKEAVASVMPTPASTSYVDDDGANVHHVADMDEFAEKHGRISPTNYLSISAYREMGRPTFVRSDHDYEKPEPIPLSMVPENHRDKIAPSPMSAEEQSKANRSLILSELYAMEGQDPAISYDTISTNIASNPAKIKAMYDMTGGLSREAWAKVFSHPDGTTYTTHPADVRMHYDGFLGGCFSIMADVRDKYGRRVAKVKRTLYKSNPLTLEVHNDLLEVEHIARGNRVADNMYERMETLLPQLAAQNDLRSCITIHANITVGKYAWAKKEKGFDFSDTDSRDTMWSMLKRMCNQNEIPLDELLEHNGYNEIYELNRPHQFRDLKWKTNFDLQNGEDSNASFGKALLMDYSDDWKAVKWIAKDAEQLNKKHNALIDEWGETSEEYDYDDIDKFVDTAGYEPRPAKPLSDSLSMLSPGVLDELGIRR